MLGSALHTQGTTVFLVENRGPGCLIGAPTRHPGRLFFLLCAAVKLPSAELFGHFGLLGESSFGGRVLHARSFLTESGNGSCGVRYIIRQPITVHEARGSAYGSAATK